MLHKKFSRFRGILGVFSSSNSSHSTIYLLIHRTGAHGVFLFYHVTSHHVTQVQALRWTLDYNASIRNIRLLKSFVEFTESIKTLPPYISGSSLSPLPPLHHRHIRKIFSFPGILNIFFIDIDAFYSARLAHTKRLLGRKSDINIILPQT